MSHRVPVSHLCMYKAAWGKWYKFTYWLGVLYNLLYILYPVPILQMISRLIYASLLSESGQKTKNLSVKEYMRSLGHILASSGSMDPQMDSMKNVDFASAAKSQNITTAPCPHLFLPCPHVPPSPLSPPLLIREPLPLHHNQPLPSRLLLPTPPWQIPSALSKSPSSLAPDAPPQINCGKPCSFFSHSTEEITGSRGREIFHGCSGHPIVAPV